MKKLFLLLGFLLVVFTSSASAFMLIAGGSESEPCPPWYSESIVAWNGLHPSGHNYLCETDGTANQADTDTATTTATGGYVQLEIDENATVGGEYLLWGDSYIDGSDAAQTVCLEIFVHTDTPSANVSVFRAGDGNNDYVYLRPDTSQDRVYAKFFTQSDPDPDVYATTLELDSWETIAYSWNVVGAADDHSANPGDEGTWADGWEDDDAEVISDMTTASDELLIGDVHDDGADAGEWVYIRKMAVVSGYKADCTALTGW